MPVRRAAVLGSPIGHSLSPCLHRAAYAALGLDWTYEAIELVAGDLGPFLAELGSEWVGLSLTMPLKQAVVHRLASASELVRITGAANTVRLTPEGLLGDNTDVPAIVELVVGLGGFSESVVILGGGATARSAVAAIADLGAKVVRVVTRKVDPALLACGRELDVEIIETSWASADSATAQAELLISTVPARIASELGADIVARGALLDVAYDPWPTWLTARFQIAGRPVATGYDLLLAQAAMQVELFTGMTAPRGAMDIAGRAELARRG